MSDVVDEHAEALYRSPPDGFVAARDERVKRLRDDGDREAAKAVAALRRPTMGAWLVNLLVLDEPGLRDQLPTLAEELRGAQDRLAGDELRALGRQRQQLVSGLVDRARGLAPDAGGHATEGALVEVEATLRAALADPDVAREVLSGRLLHGRDFSGFGPVPAGPPKADRRTADVAGGRPKSRPTKSSGAADRAADRDRRKADRERERREREARKAQARQAVRDAEAAKRDAATRLDETAGALASAERTLADAQAGADAARAAHAAAERAAEQATEAVKAARQELRRSG